jgi:tetratricopeptide (TPR) repeat protein
MSTTSPNTPDGKEHFTLKVTIVGLLFTGLVALLALQDGGTYLKLMASGGLFVLLAYLAFVLFQHEKGKLLSVLVAFMGFGFLGYAVIIAANVYRGTSGNTDPFSKCSDSFNKKNYQDAIDCYKKAGNLGDNFTAKKQLGESFAAVGRRVEAGQMFKDIFDQNPDEVRPLISKVYFELAVNEYDNGNKKQAIRYQAILRSYDEAAADKLKTRFGL